MHAPHPGGNPLEPEPNAQQQGVVEVPGNVAVVLAYIPWVLPSFRDVLLPRTNSEQRTANGKHDAIAGQRYE